MNTTEAGITVGPMVFLGDLGGHAGKGTTFIKDYNMNTTKIAIGAYVTAYPAQWLGFRFSLNYGKIQGDDANISSHGGWEETRKARNLDFRSTILEGTVMAEFYPTVFLEDESDDVTGRLRPYGVLGLGAFPAGHGLFHLADHLGLQLKKFGGHDVPLGPGFSNRALILVQDR